MLWFIRIHAAEGSTLNTPVLLELLLQMDFAFLFSFDRGGNCLLSAMPVDSCIKSTSVFTQMYCVILVRHSECPYRKVCCEVQKLITRNVQSSFSKRNDDVLLCFLWFFLSVISYPALCWLKVYLNNVWGCQSAYQSICFINLKMNLAQKG